MIGFIGNVLIWTAFAASLAALAGYGWSAQSKNDTLYRFSNYLFALKGLLVIAASGLLIHLILTHQFQYYYVFNYTSKDLPLKYLVSAFYGGQEGSFLLWILFSAFVGVILMRFTREPYRKPVLFIITLNQVFLLSMVAGIDFGTFKLGASPFRTLAQEMPNAPFIQQNPDFVPSDGSGLNDLLRSPWMMIHPPILFLGFSLMTVPYAYAMAALWKKRYQKWVNPALPWTLGANLCLLFAIFLGGYWAYVTLSFGGYWAWDPVENASFVPWLFGIAGVHTMLIQRKSSTSQKASLIFAILAYIAVVYETFLTRSGILSDSSVHSFVDLGLYNQLLVFMGVIAALGVGLLLYRYKELPKQEKESPLLSREFMTFSGAMILFLIGLVILLGTSSPVIGKLFVENPTPPEVSFYNEWTMPLAMIAALLTVLGQYLFWKRYDAESLASALLLPLLITSAVTLTNIIYVNIQDIYYMAYLFTAWFALVGNSFVMVRLARRKPKLIGGATSHIGFAILLLGILGSSAYNSNLLDRETRNYNEAVEQGQITDDNGFPVQQKVEMIELKLNEPKLVNNEYLLTFEGFTVNQGPRPGQQTYKIKVEEAQGEGSAHYMYPVVYPMKKRSSGQNVEWSVEPSVRAGFWNDIYLYVAGSSFVEDKNEEVEKAPNQMRPASAKMGGDGEQGSGQQSGDESDRPTLTLTRGDTKQIGRYKIHFKEFIQADTADMPSNASIGVRSKLQVTDTRSDSVVAVEPLFAVVERRDGSYSYAPPVDIENWNLTLQFSNVDPGTGKITLEFRGIQSEPIEKAWVLVSAEEKPFISIVWLGTFILMFGFLISIFRHASRPPSSH